jgi:hypothetical protein
VSGQARDAITGAAIPGMPKGSHARCDHGRIVGWIESRRQQVADLLDTVGRHCRQLAKDVGTECSRLGIHGLEQLSSSPKGSSRIVTHEARDEIEPPLSVRWLQHGFYPRVAAHTSPLPQELRADAKASRTWVGARH